MFVREMSRAKFLQHCWRCKGKIALENLIARLYALLDPEAHFYLVKKPK
jgi:hypothetical protein